VANNNCLAGNIGLYCKKQGNGRVDLSSHWLAVEQNGNIGTKSRISKPNPFQGHPELIFFCVGLLGGYEIPAVSLCPTCEPVGISTLLST
jgi:hypothetical protein